jgi:hypothetical protein
MLTKYNDENNLKKLQFPMAILEINPFTDSSEPPSRQLHASS